MCRKIVATRMRCCGFRSAPRPSGTAVGQSGTAVDQVSAGLRQASWCGWTSTYRGIASTELRRNGQWSTSQAGSAGEAQTGRKMSPLATMRKGVLRPFSYVSQNGRDQNAMLRIPVSSATEWNCGRPFGHGIRPSICRAQASIIVQPDLHAPLDDLDRIASRRTMVDLTSRQRRGGQNRSEDESFNNNEEEHPPPIFVCIVK